MPLVNAGQSASADMLCLHPCTLDAQAPPYNNFEVLDVQRFSSPPVRALNGAVDATHNIYRHRCTRLQIA